MYYLIKKVIYVSGNHENTVSEFETPTAAKAEFHAQMGALMKGSRVSEVSLAVTDWQNHVILADYSYIQPLEKEVADDE